MSLSRFYYLLSKIDCSFSILVLKDGQIVEQGSHKELLARGGVFATMWADQISSSGDPTGSLVDRSAKNEAVSGYLDDQTEPNPVVEATEDETPGLPDEHVASDAPETITAPLESTENVDDAPPPLPAKEDSSSGRNCSHCTTRIPQLW